MAQQQMMISLVASPTSISVVVLDGTALATASVDSMGLLLTLKAHVPTLTIKIA